jgi:hypothetical protein
MLIGPSLYGLEHVALDFNTLTAKGRVVESSKDIVDDLVNWHTGVFPSCMLLAELTEVGSLQRTIENTTDLSLAEGKDTGQGQEDLRYCVLEDSGGHTPSTGIENIREVIL